MGLVMSPGAVVSQLDSMNEGMEKMIDDAKYMLHKIFQLEETTDELQGESYDNIREYYGILHRAVIHGIILFAEAMIQENNAYKGCIAGCLSGISYVDEDALEKDKEHIQEQIQYAYGMMAVTKGSYTAMIGSLERALDLVEKKLDQIEAFMGATGGLYQNVNSYKANVKKGIECLHSSVFDGSRIDYQIDHVDLCWMQEIGAEWTKKELQVKEPFVKCMEEHFGFDRETAEIMYKLYDRMDMAGVENIDQKFFLMLASVNYPCERTESRDLIMVPKNLNDLWYVLMGTYREDELEYELQSYGLNGEEIEKLEGEIENNHKLNIIKGNNYFEKVDFGHMAVVMALLLVPEENIWTGAGDAAGVFNGIFDLEANAGYVGDVYGTGGNGPKLTPDDYKADLDAVNLSNRIQTGDNAIVAMNRYYTGIADGTVNRAREFAANIGNGNEREGIQLLYRQADQHEIYNWVGDVLKAAKGIDLKVFRQPGIDRECMEEREKIIRNFIRSVQEEKNEYEAYEEVNINIAENGKKDGKE